MDDLWSVSLKLAGLGFAAFIVGSLFSPNLASLGLYAMGPAFCILIFTPLYLLLSESTGWAITACFLAVVFFSAQFPGCQVQSYEPERLPFCGERFGCD